jgi:hypothetical protein
LSTNLTIQQARIEDITLKEDYGNMIITQDDDFGDMGFGMGSMLLNGQRDDLLFDHSMGHEPAAIGMLLFFFWILDVFRVSKNVLSNKVDQSTEMISEMEVNGKFNPF